MRCSPGGLVSLAHNRASRARARSAVARIGSLVTCIRSSGARLPPPGVHRKGFGARTRSSVARTRASGAGKGSPGTGILSSGAPTTKGDGVARRLYCRQLSLRSPGPSPCRGGACAVLHPVGPSLADSRSPSQAKRTRKPEQSFCRSQRLLARSAALRLILLFTLSSCPPPASRPATHEEWQDRERQVLTVSIFTPLCQLLDRYFPTTQLNLLFSPAWFGEFASPL